jgi:DNA-binding PadR family transcriptional regulator
MVVAISEILILQSLKEKDLPLREIYKHITSLGCTISYSDTYVKLRQLKAEDKVTSGFGSGSKQTLNKNYSLTEQGRKTLSEYFGILERALHFQSSKEQVEK